MGTCCVNSDSNQKAATKTEKVSRKLIKYEPIPNTEDNQQTETDSTKDLQLKLQQLQDKYDRLQSNNNQLSTQVKSLQESQTNRSNIHTECNQSIQSLKIELANSQKQILDMTNIVGVKQSLPTVQEAIAQFHSLRDQQHHNTFTKIKAYIKSKGYKYQKYYINQIVHEIMFNILIESYNSVIRYKKSMYDQISAALNMKHSVKQMFTSNLSDNETDGKTEERQQSVDNECIEKEILRILTNRIGSFCKNNYQYILKVEEIRNDIMGSIENKFIEYLGDINEEINVQDSLNKYIYECCEICWVMILQEPVLELMPVKWYEEDKNKRIQNKFEEKIHNKVLGSARKCDVILYNVWPVITRSGLVLEDQKIDVVLRTELYEQYKQKQNK